MGRPRAAAGAPAPVPAVEQFGEEVPAGGGDDDVPF
jgi:hypothetical protein